MKKVNYIYYSFVALFLVIGVGISGFFLVEGYSFIEAFYMTMITISTVGFEEVRPLSTNGMLFTSFLIVISFGVFAYFITNATKFILDGEFRNLLKNKKMESTLKGLKNHVIVCGFGRNGRQAVLDLLLHNERVLLIENNDGVVEDEANDEIRKNKNFFHVHGDAVNEDVLLRCKIESAKALITTLPSDADNLFITLTVREFNKTMTLISRASEEHSDVKLRRAGATNVIMPDKIGGTRMAKLVSQPGVIEFIESLLLRSGVDVNIEEISCSDLDSHNINKSIKDLNIRSISGANLIGLKTKEGDIVYNPSPERVITADDKLFVMGTSEEIESLTCLFVGKSKNK
ncbi:MAG: hypothetical protein B6I20_11835 [Bacteroidetes bacterium 4572_117]|nr:MAG: hypothetical protein B6I20_11835 [Bacteroidetes bacterium 4572_117]